MDSHALSGDAADEVVMAVLPERGLIFSELTQLQLQLCKPKLLPIKSFALERLEKMEKKLAQEAREVRDLGRVQRQTLQEWASPDLAAGGGVRTIPALTSPSMAVPAPLPDTTSIPLRGGSAIPPSAAPAAASSTESIQAASKESLSCPQTHTKEDAYAGAPMSATECSSRVSSATDVSSSSSSLTSMTG